MSITHLLNEKSYDQHLNMVLGEVEETITSVEIDEETYEEVYKVSFRVYLSDTLRIIRAESRFLSRFQFVYDF